MATYVKGDAVENATSYELFEKSGNTYISLATASQINFEVSALGLNAGQHTLVVKAKADGYLDSAYSNEVVYRQGTAETVWYTSATKDASGNFPVAKLALEGSGFTYFNESTHDKYQGKMVNRIAFVPSESGTLTVYKMNQNTAGATSTVIKVLTVNETDLNTYAVYELPDTEVGSTEYISVFNKASDTAKFQYWNVSSDYTKVTDQGMILCAIDGSYISSEKGACGFDLGCYY